MNSRGMTMGGLVLLALLLSLNCSTQPDNAAGSTDGVAIHFSQRGEGEPAIVFVHGWSNNRSIWDAQMSHFAENYKAVAVDLAGFGESGNNRSDWTIQSFGQDVTAVIDKLNLNQVVLVGFSMGAPVVVEAANMNPDRVVGVVIVDGLQNVEMKVPPQMVAYIDSVFMDLIKNPSNEKLMAGGFYKKNPETSYKRVMAMLEGAPRTGWRESLNNTFKWQNEDCIESLKKISVPVVAINSEREPTNAEAFRKYVPSFQANIIPDAGHLVMWDATEQFNQLLEQSIQDFVSERK